MIRTGIGYDSHRFGADRPLVLGGVVIPGGRGLTGHSDADAVAHALIDALLGAAALGDIGAMFPDHDPQWKDADSMRLLVLAVARLRSEGWQPLQCDITVILEAPKLAPHVPAIRRSLADALGLAIEAVSCKAKTNEMMGFVGRGEGLAVLAVAGIGPAL
jgi:2-C-methyl-D-erythritol 2,4-cyclodiphosphate synthase